MYSIRKYPPLHAPVCSGAIIKTIDQTQHTSQYFFVLLCALSGNFCILLCNSKFMIENIFFSFFFFWWMKIYSLVEWLFVTSCIDGIDVVLFSVYKYIYIYPKSDIYFSCKNNHCNFHITIQSCSSNYHFFFFFVKWLTPTDIWGCVALRTYVLMF